ncbi:MAG: hypothetical protein ACLQGP_27050 [Isosphaeraceae bacterium]
MNSSRRLNGKVAPREGASAGPRTFVRGTLAHAIGTIILAVGAAKGAAPPRANPALVLVGRTVEQDQGAWVVDYRLRLAGQSGAIIMPEEIGVKVDGWVSNSRVASHAVPRWSSLGISRGPEFSVVGEVIAAADEAHRCREKLIVSVWGEDQCPCGPGSTARGGARAGDRPGAASGPESGREPGPAGPTAGLPLSVAPGRLVHVRLRLEHQHVLYGDYDPLLAIREVELAVGGSTIRDLVALDREQYLAHPKATWPEPPEERRDTRHAVTGADSLHLEAHVPGHHYYRFPDRPVRYGTKMRLRFWYLVAAGTEGEGRARIAQYKDTPTSWRLLNSAGFERCLKTVGRWTKAEYLFTTDAEATTLALDFRIAGDGDIGEMWIDDVSLEPVGSPGQAGP